MTNYVVYSLDNAIETFFSSSTSATRQQCDTYATSYAGGTSTPLQMQGVCSYTVVVGSNKNNPKLIQFRADDSILNMDQISLAKDIHPEFVASCRYLGTIGDSRPLHIYEMDYLLGTPQIMASIPVDDLPRQRNTIKGLARFFAQSWNNNQRILSHDASTSILLDEFQSNFDLLAQELPPRFAANLDRVRKNLPSLFSATFPLVLSHGDLNTMNLLINPQTGNITGIVDWAESRNLPFGFSLYGLENIFGWMDSEGWHYYEHHRALESHFWQTFREEANHFSDGDLHLVRAARVAGLFYHYGFVFDAKGVVQSVRNQPDGFLAYLDAFCTVE